MKRTMLASLCFVCFLALGACAVGQDEGSVDQVQQEATGGKLCLSSDECNACFYCTTETGDCLSPPNCKNQPCLAVCYGRCAKGSPCGDTLCHQGLECCNASCGICTEPGGYCTQQICTPDSTL